MRGDPGIVYEDRKAHNERLLDSSKAHIDATPSKSKMRIWTPSTPAFSRPWRRTREPASPSSRGSSASPPPSAAERVRRLEEAGVIEGYAVVDRSPGSGPAGRGLDPHPADARRAQDGRRRFCATLPEIVECDRVTGEDCFVARAHLKSIEDLERLIDQIIPHAMTTTSIIQSTLVKRRPPPIVSDIDKKRRASSDRPPLRGCRVRKSSSRGASSARYGSP